MRDLEEVKTIVRYFNEHHSTVRATAKHFGISKSSVYIYLTKVMPNKVSNDILQQNKAERHLRGGKATQKKYLKNKAV